MSATIIPKLQGGPCDGQKFYVSQGQLNLMVPENPPVTMRWDVQPRDTILLHMYEARPFRSSKLNRDGILYLMFCHPSLPEEEALMRAKEWIGD